MPTTEDARFCRKCGKRVGDDYIDPDLEQRRLPITFGAFILKLVIEQIRYWRRIHFASQL